MFKGKICFNILELTFQTAKGKIFQVSAKKFSYLI